MIDRGTIRIAAVTAATVLVWITTVEVANEVILIILTFLVDAMSLILTIRIFYVTRDTTPSRPSTVRAQRAKATTNAEAKRNIATKLRLRRDR